MRLSLRLRNPSMNDPVQPENWPRSVDDMEARGYSDWMRNRKAEPPASLPAELRTAYQQGWMDAWAQW